MAAPSPAAAPPPGTAPARSLLVNLSFLIPQPTGLSVYALNVIPHLRPLDPLLLTPYDFPDFACAPVPGGMTSDRGSKGHLRRLLWTQFRLPARYRRADGRLLFCPIPEAPLWAGCRTAVMAHDLIPLRYGPPRSRLRAYFRHYVPRVLHQAEAVLCNSQATADDLMRFFDLPARKIFPVLLAHDPDRYRWLDLPAGSYFLCLGRNDPYKNLEAAIAGFGQFVRDTGDRACELWLAGPADPRYQPPLLAAIAAWDLGDRVKFRGYVPDAELPTLLNRAIALVFPSRWEGFGLPVLEAMACGTPVVAARRSSLPEVAGDAALWIDPDRPAEIAAAMGRLVKDPALRSQLRSAGLARSGQFSWTRTGRATAEILARYL